MRYKKCRYNGKRMCLHVAIWIQHNGPVPEGFQIHHINFNRLDNRIENLTCMSHSDHARLHAIRRRRNSKGVFV